MNPLAQTLFQTGRFSFKLSRGVCFFWIMVVGTIFARGQTSVTLAWNQVTSSVAGYRVYQGGRSGEYTNSFDAAKNLTFQITQLKAGATYYFAVSSYLSSGVESPFSSEVSYTASSSALPPPVLNLTPGTTLVPSAATITSPFRLSNGMISQSSQTTLSTGGSAVYTVTNAIPGNYVISAQVIAPSSSANSFYVNVDSQPTDPTMIWNLAVSSVATNELVSWQGISDLVPKVFFMSAGNHQVIVRGREGNAQLGAITFLPAPFSLQVLPNRQVVLSGVAQPTHSYTVQATSDFIHWTVVGTVTTDSTGQFSFIDSTAANAPARHYRLRG